MVSKARSGNSTAADVRRVAMNLLARREHAQAELSRKLADRGFDAAQVEDVLADLRREGLQSDERFVDAVLAATVRRGKGPAYARDKLRHSGVDREQIDEALETCQADWLALARLARGRRFGDSVPADYSERARQARFLQQRGFDTHTIYEVLAS